MNGIASPPPQEDYSIAPPGVALSVAKFISYAIAPHSIALLILFLAGIELGVAELWWVLFYVVMVVVLPVLYIWWLMYTKQVPDFYLRVRTDRYRPMIFTVLTGGIAWLVMVLGNAPVLMISIALAAWILCCLMLLITLRWKISAHGAAVAILAVIGWKLTTPVVAMGFTALVPVVGWARVRMRRHTLSQVIGGCILGGGVFFAAFALVQFF